MNNIYWHVSKQVNNIHWHVSKLVNSIHRHVSEQANNMLSLLTIISVKFSSLPQPQSKSNTSWSLPIDSLSRGRNILKTSLIGSQVHPQHPLSDPTTWRRCTNTSTSSTSWATTTTVGFKLKRKLSAEWLNNGKRGGAMTESECDCIVRSQSYEDEQGLNKGRTYCMHMMLPQVVIRHMCTSCIFKIWEEMFDRNCSRSLAHNCTKCPPGHFQMH